METLDGKETHPMIAGSEQTTWNIKQDKAAGKLMLNIPPDQ